MEGEGEEEGKGEGEGEKGGRDGWYCMDGDYGRGQHIGIGGSIRFKYSVTEQPGFVYFKITDGGMHSETFTVSTSGMNASLLSTRTRACPEPEEGEPRPPDCGTHIISYYYRASSLTEGAMITVTDNNTNHELDEKDQGADIYVTRLLKVEDPSNEEFSIQLGLDIMRALAWQEGAGWPASARWNHYDGDGQPLVNEVGAWGIMNVRKGVWATWFAREYDPAYKPHGYTVCEWNEMAWNWKTNIANGKYIHQTYMYEKQNATQKTWPNTAVDPSTPNREDLASYGYLWNETLMQAVTSETWTAIIEADTHTQNIRGYKASKPWE